MNQEDIGKAIELIEQSSSFGVLLPEQPDFDTLAAAEALVSVLWSGPKVTGLLSPTTLPADTDKTVFPKLTSPTPLLKEFIISVDTSHTPVSQLRYEKPENRIDIILTPKLTPLGKEVVSFREGTIRCDCLIAIAVPNIERLANIADFAPDFFTENKLINIDIGDVNTHYGEANCVDASRASRSELVWQLLSARPAATIPKHVSTLLLAGILAATRELTTTNTSADTLTAAAELMRLDADHAEAQKLIARQARPRPLSLLQLFARAAVRSKQDKENGILWSFLTIEDLAKTNRTSDDAPEALEYIRVTLPKSLATVLLWQDSSHFEDPHGGDVQSDAPIRILLAGDQQVLDAIASKEETERIDQGIRLAASFPSFRDAEEYVRSLIRTAL